ncbi:MAG: hypothetical protein ABGY41_11595, partial [Candidatus Poribacteria bacterium]
MRTRLWIGALLLVGVVAAAVLVGRRQPPTRPTDAARTSDTEASAGDVVTRVMQMEIHGAQNEDLPPPIYPDYGPLRPGW